MILICKKISSQVYKYRKGFDETDELENKIKSSLNIKEQNHYDPRRIPEGLYKDKNGEWKSKNPKDTPEIIKINLLKQDLMLLKKEQLQPKQ